MKPNCVSPFLFPFQLVPGGTADSDSDSSDDDALGDVMHVHMAAE